MAHPKLQQKDRAETAPKKAVIGGKITPKLTVQEKPAILKTNVIIAFCLLTVVALSMISYMGVISKETKVKELHSVTNKVNYENIELQNKVDYLKSFYVLDNNVQKIDFLEKPEQVIEVKPNSKSPIIQQKKKKFDITPVPGF